MATRTPRRETKDERARLREGAAALGVRLAPEALDLLERYLGELRTWMARVNLVSRSDAPVLIERHLADSLAAAPLLERETGPGSLVIDVGSGAGLPGVPLAAVLRDRRFLLLEPRSRRASFLGAVARALPELSLEIRRERLEDMARAGGAARAAAVVSRAALPAEQLLRLSAPLLRADGIAIAYVGRSEVAREEDRPGRSAPGFGPASLVPYRLPGSGAELLLICWRRQDEAGS